MTMLFVDGCQYNAALTEKWSAVTSTSYSTTTARTGNRSIRLGGASVSGVLTKTFGSSYGTLSVAFGGYVGTGGLCRVQLLDSAGAIQMTVNIPSGGAISVYRGSETGTLLGSGGSITFGSWFHLELDATIHDSTGAVDVYLNGASVISLSGVDTKNTAIAGATSVRFTGPNAFSNPYLYIDDVVISDTYAQIGAAIVQTLYPTGAGATTQWTPSAGANYAAVDETTGDGDTTYVSTSTLNNIDTYTFGDLTANSGAVLAVAVNIVGRADAGGSPQVTPVLRPGSTDRLGTGVAQTATYANGQSIWESNPDGGSWTEAAVNASEAGIKKTV
jgi:hypothetical protein